MSTGVLGGLGSCKFVSKKYIGNIWLYFRSFWGGSFGCESGECVDAENVFCSFIGKK